jgi:hypothetical protein
MDLVTRLLDLNCGFGTGGGGGGGENNNNDNTLHYK